MNETLKMNFHVFNDTLNSTINIRNVEDRNLSDVENINENCDTQLSIQYNTTFGVVTAVAEWEAVTTILVLTVVIVGTIFGNVLVILGVFVHRPLRIVPNFFIVSLAVADLAVAILVMPLNVAYSTLGRWLWGKHLCKIWLTSDILCCTSSILNLCAIALDRYWAITDPINYACKRTLKRVVLQIVGVWVLSLAISSPPLLGWNDWPNEFTVGTPCQLTSERGYVVYSSFGSFYIPLIIMTIVYIKIYIATKQRIRRRTVAARILKRKPKVEMEILEKESHSNKEDSDNDSESSQSIKRCQIKAFMDIKRNLFMPLFLLHDPATRQRLQMDIDQLNPGPSTSSPSYGSKIVESIRRVSLKRKRQGKPLLANVNNKGNVVHQFIEEKQKISLNKERRAARTLGIIMGVFVVCWLPFFLTYSLLPFCPWCCPNSKIINFITWLGYINSTVNPIIYTIFNLDFRKAFKKLLGCSK